MNDRPLSDALREANRPLWEAMQAHRFVADILADQLQADVFARYLFFEYRFVESAILIFGHALLKAPGMDERRWTISVLRGLAEDQIDYFMRAFRALGLCAGQATAPLPPPVEAFRAGMLEVAESGGWLDVLATMLAAEWMYAAWCSRAAVERISEPELRRWIDLHATAPFRAGVHWMRAHLDGAGATLSAPEQARLAALFGRALTLEIDFHAAAYDAGWLVPRQERA